MRTKRASYSRKRVPRSLASLRRRRVCPNFFSFGRSRISFFFFLGNQGRELYLGRDHEFFLKKKLPGTWKNETRGAP